MSDKERSAKELIKDLMHFSVLISDLNSEIGFLEGVRYVGKGEPPEKSPEQVSREETRNELRIKIKDLKQEIAEKLGIKEEAKQIKASDFPVFLMVNFKTTENGKLTRINESIIPPQEASLDMIRNSQLF